MNDKKVKEKSITDEGAVMDFVEEYINSSLKSEDSDHFYEVLADIAIGTLIGTMICAITSHKKTNKKIKELEDRIELLEKKKA